MILEITRSVLKNPNVGQSHVGWTSEGDIREKETTREVVDGKQPTIDVFGGGFLLKWGKKWGSFRRP